MWMPTAPVLTISALSLPCISEIPQSALSSLLAAGSHAPAILLYIIQQVRGF